MENAYTLVVGRPAGLHCQIGIGQLNTGKGKDPFIVDCRKSADEPPPHSGALVREGLRA